jgi:hypothetical protein
MKYLLTIEIKGKEKVWLRSILLSSLPEKEDLVFYYRRLCGMQDIEINMTSETVPEIFNESLLSSKAPSVFPTSDMECAVKETQKQRQYKVYIKQLCEMERTRVQLQGYTKTEPVQAEEGGIKTILANNVRNQRKAWVQEILKTLNQDQEYEDALVTVADCPEASPPIAWIFTPAVSSVRETKGSRFLLDPVLGKLWDERVGTDLYPDFLVSRRLTTANWAFQHEESKTFLQSIVNWYILSQDAKTEEGVSDWILDADHDVNIFLSAIRKIKINERHLKNDDLPQNQVFKILSIIENQYLQSSVENPDIHPMSSDVFLKFMKYVFLTSNIPKEQFWGSESFRKILQRWEQNKLGFRPRIDPYIAGWKEMWSVLMGDQVTTEKLLLFLETLDCWDPMESIMIANPQRMRLARDWINLYIDTQMIQDQNSLVRSPILHDRVQQWVYKFLPQQTFLHNITPMTIGPTFTARGFSTNKLPTGRWTSGLKYREETIAPVMADNFHSVAQETVKKVRKPAVRKKKTDTIVSIEESANQVVHEPSSEIHLGNI